MRYLVLAATLLSSTAFANDIQSAEFTEPQLATPSTPMAAVSVVEAVGGVQKILNSTEISRSNPNHNLCWDASGVGRSHPDGHRVQETIQSPAFMRFVDPNASIYSGDNGTRHIISSVEVGTADSVGRCWKFDNTDPVGNYTLTLNVDGVEFPSLAFTVVP